VSGFRIMGKKIFMILAAAVLLPSCSYEPYCPDHFMERHFYGEARDVFFYNGVEALSRAIRWSIVDTVSVPGDKEAAHAYLLDGMRVFEKGDTLEIGALNYVREGKSLFETGAVWTVTNDYIDDFEYVMEYSGEMAWTVSFKALMKLREYDNEIEAEGEYLLRYVSGQGGMMSQDFTVEYAEGSYRDHRELEDGIGVIDIRIKSPVNLTYKVFDDPYTPAPFYVEYYELMSGIHLYGGEFFMYINTLPDNEFDNGTYIFDLNSSTKDKAEVYASYKGIGNYID